MPLTVLANKCDKLKKSELEPNLALIRETLALPESVPLIAFSAQSGAGRDALMTEIFAHI
jgi:GTP-binding protein